MLSFTATITEVLKNNIASPLAVKGSVIITSPSGKVKIGDRVVSALDSAFPPPGVNDSYLLFLKYIPATGAYTTLYKVSFGVSNNGGRQRSEGEWAISLANPLRKSPQGIVDAKSGANTQCFRLFVTPLMA